MKTWLRNRLLGFLIWALLAQTVWPLAPLPVSASALPFGETFSAPQTLGLADLRIVRVHEIEPPAPAAPHEPLPPLAFYGPPASGVSPVLPPINTLPSAQPPALPPAGPLATPIAMAQLVVQVLGPAYASLGAPIGGGELYTAVIRNSSIYTAYGVYLSAVFPTFFLADGGHSLISSTGSIPFSMITGTGTLTWTPTVTYNLAPGGVITLNFKLRATCDAQSGQQIRVSVHYNADPPPAPPVEVNSGGLNITTGRGNLVIKKEPALQNLGTPDFGKPITWTVTVQNTGLGALFEAVITDTGGINLSQPGGDLVPSVTIPRLEINETRVYTVIGTVEACNFTNIAQGAWICGNQAGDATYTNPLTTTASVLFTPEIPHVEISVSPPITCPYCTPVTRTLTLTITNTGGPAGRFRLDSTLESGFWQVVPGSVSPGWTYNPATGVFSYTAGSPTGTLPNTAGGPITLSLDIYPSTAPICDEGTGEIAFEPHFNDICTDNPFRANAVETGYTYGASQQPTMSVSKNGPSIVNSGQVFTYQVTVSGRNPAQMAMPVRVTDTLPSPPFELIGPVVPGSGITAVNGTQVTWAFTPTANPFTETLYYVMRVLTDTQSGGACQSSEIVNNQVQAVVWPTCPGCPAITDTEQVETAIQNNEGVFPFGGSAGSNEVCGPGGFTINTHYLITGSTTITWNGAIYTEALGTPIGEGALPGPVYLDYVSGTLSVTVNGVDYTTLLTPVVTAGGQLVIDLSPLQAAGAPTQSLTLWLTYTVSIPEGALNGAVDQSFYDWSQLYLPGVSDQQACATNGAFNQALPLSIGRGDLSPALGPHILNRCSVNPVVITLNDNTPGRLTDHIVVTYSASSAEVASARNFAFLGSLATISPITIITDVARGLITFTLPVTADLSGAGEIRFDVDIDCNIESVWQTGVHYQSRCAVTHGQATARDHLYQAPSLILFATPIRYTLREKEALWKFFVINNGNYTATNVQVINDFSGLLLTGFTADDSAVTATLTYPAVFTIPQLGPNQMRTVTVTAEAISCQPLYVNLNANYACFGASCANPTARVDFDTPPPYLLTNNGQTADLPMCDLGQVVFTTKNASADVTLYQLNITETLRGLTPVPGEPITLTIWDAQGIPVATTTAFTPTQSWNGLDLRLTWWYTAAPGEVVTWFNALPPLYVVRIQIPVQTSCVPPAVPQSFAAASALGPCNQQLGYTENAVTLRTLAPDMDLRKQGRSASSNFGDTVYAGPGETVIWRIEAQNIDSARSYLAHNTVLSDSWPVNFTFITATLDFTPTVITAQNLITWNIGDMYPATTHVFYITGTVGMESDSCSPQTINHALLRFGCDHDGCTSGLSPMDSANLVARPNLTLTLTPAPINTCGGTVAITVRNDGSKAYTNALTLTIPSGFAYDGLVSSTLTVTQIITDDTTPVLRWDEIPGRTDAAPYEFTLVIRLRSATTGGSFCPSANGQPITATMGYDDHWVCTDSGPYSVTHSATLTGRDPVLTVNKMPDTVTLPTGEWITWTIRVTNTGSGDAANVVVTDVVGNNYTGIGAGNGSNGEPPTINGNTITWTLSNPIVPGGVWTTTVWAQMLTIGDNRNVVTATAYCASGCWSASASDTARVTLLQEFDKSPTIQTGTVGSLMVFTLSASLSDEDALYRSLTLTDTLPAGLGYVSSVLTYTYDQDVGGGTMVVSTTPTVSPALYASGPVVWRLGDVSGTIGINGVITAVIQNVTAAFDGARLVNDLRMTYIDDDQLYTYTDTANVDVLEPILHIGKSYVTPYGCGATLFQYNYNNLSDAGWSELGTTWAPSPEGYYRYQNPAPPTNQRAFAGNTTWTDYSFSFMMRTEDSNGSMGGYVRQNNAGTTDTGYLFRWSDTQMTLEQRNPNLTLQTVPGGYTVNRWYHVEMRVTGNLIQVFVDGQLRLSAVNNTHTVGRVGLLASSLTRVDFDDILVTRLGNQSCYVGANDLVTYTLTVSNQARLTGYDLVITDMLPAGMSFVTSTMSSNDPAATVVYTPSVGATGVLTWGVSQLAPTTPFTSLTHTALTLTVVLQIADGITANTVLSNQAFLNYDAWVGATQPTTVTRPYSGGSHSTAIRTVYGGLTKTVTFDPPPTATLGTLVTYTLIVPATPITATLYNVVVTDTVDSRMRIEGVTVTGGTGGHADLAGQVVTATFASIPHDTQAYITVTARISHEWPNPAGDANAGQTITNSAVMTSSSTPLTTSNVVSTVVGEPNLLVRKTAASTGIITDLDGTALLTYTIRITNTGTSPAYSVHITDAVPAGISVTALYGGDDRSAPVVGPGTLTWTIGYISNTAPANVAVLTYTARISQALVNAWLTNTVDILYHSLTETIPGVRPYTNTDQASVETVPPDVSKFTEPFLLRVGDIVTYQVVFTIPAGTVWQGHTLVDSLTPGLWYITDSETLAWTPSTVNVTITSRVSNTTEAPGSQVIRWTFAPITSEQDIPTVVTLTFQAQAVGLRIDTLEPVWITQTERFWPGNYVQLEFPWPDVVTDVVTNLLIQPDLSIDKASTPSPESTVGAGNRITYTLTVTNSGYGLAYDIVISDVLPAELFYVTSTIASTAPPYIAFLAEPPLGATGVLTWRVNELWGREWAPQYEPKVATITVVAQVTDTVGANLTFTNTAAIPYYDSQPGDGPGPYPPDEREYTDGSDSVPHRTVDAAILKTVTPPTATLGHVITYVIVVPATPITATLYNVTVTDQLDTRLQLHAVADGPDGTCSGTGFILCYYPSIPAGQQRFITVTAVLSDPLGAVAGDVITNLAVLRHQDGGPTPSNQPAFTVTEPSLTLVKASDPPTSSTVRVGESVTYTVRITNSSAITASPAYDILFTDTLPVGMRATPPALLAVTLNGSPVAATDYVTGYDPASGVFTIAFTPAFSIPVGGELVIQYAATVDSNAPAATDLTNQAEATWSSLPGPVPGDRDYGPISDTTTVHTPLAVGLTKAVTPPTVTVGSQVVFSITLPVPPVGAVLHNVVFTDVVDSRLRIDAVSPNAAFSGQVVTATFTTIPTYTQEVIVITATVRDLVTVTAGTQITDVAVFDYRDNPAGPISSNPVTVTVAEPNVTLDKSVQVPRDPLGAGDIVTYTLVLSNTGTWPAYDLMITDSLPAGLSFVSTVGFTVTDPVTATLGGDYPAWTVSQLNVGGYVYITFTAQVAGNIGAGLTLTNSAWGDYSSLPGPSPDERTYPILTDTVPVQTGYPALDLEKQVVPDRIEAGERLTYTLTVTNTGIVSATDVVITDIIPLNTTLVTATLPHTGPDAGGVISWPLGTLDIGVPRVVTMVVQTNSPLTNGIIILNTAWVTCTEGLTDTDTVTTPVGSAPILSLVKTSADGNGSPLRPGDRLTYTLTVLNSGNENASNVTVSDTVPAHTTYVPGSIAGGDSQNDTALPQLFWTINLLPPGAPVQLTFAVTVNLPLTNSLALPNTAVVTATEVPTPTTDTVTDTVVSTHTLAVYKSAEPAVVQAGDLLTYTLAYTITGDEPVYGVVVSDTTPAHTTFYTATPPATSDPGVGGTGPVVWNLGDFLPPESGITQATGVLTLVVLVDSPLVSGTVLYNAVAITDTSGLTDTDDVTTPVESAHTLSITKTADPAVVQAGDQLTYTLTWTVTGNEPAFGVTISDTVPVSTTYQACYGGLSCDYAGGVVTWALGDLYPPASGVVTLVVLVDSPLVSGTVLYNAVAITDTSGLTDTDDVTTPVESAHTLSITKMADPAVVQAGDQLTYTLTWAVTGNEPAFGVTVSDTVPVSTSYVSCSGGLSCGLGSGGVVTWALGDQYPLALGVVTMVVRVDSDVPAGAFIYNAVVITDTSGLTDTDDITTPVQTRADLAVTKSDDPDPVIVGTLLTYTLVVTNNGPSVARNAVVTDTLPPEVAFVSAAPAQSSGPNPLVWNLGDIAVNEVRRLTVTVRVLVTTTDVFTNAVVVGSDTPDDNPDNNQDEEPTTPLVPGLEIVKLVSAGQAVRNMPFTYTIRITNTGQVTLNPLIVTDTLPPDFHYTPGTGNPSEPDIQIGQTLIWSNLGALAPGASLTLSFGVTATPGILGTYWNVVTATGFTPGGPITDTGDVPIQINDPAIVLEKQIIGVDTDIVAPNYITFTLTITNVGISIIDVLPLVDQYDTYYLSFVDATPYPEQDDDDGLLTWNDLTGPAPNGYGRNLLPGESLVITTMFRIAHDINVTTTNIATVTNATDIYLNPPADDDDEVQFGGDGGGFPTPITLLYLRATAQEGAVRVEWATIIELDTTGFDLYRGESENWAEAEQIAHLSATGSNSRYSYLDTRAASGRRYWYWLAERTPNDTAPGTLYGPVQVEMGLSWQSYRLYLPLVFNQAARR